MFLIIAFGYHGVQCRMNQSNIGNEKHETRWNGNFYTTDTSISEIARLRCITQIKHDSWNDILSLFIHVISTHLSTMLKFVCNCWVLFNSTVTVWTLQTLVVVVSAVEQKLGFDGFEPNAIDRGSHLRLSSWHACHCGSLTITKLHWQPWFYSMYCSKLRSGAPLCFQEVEFFQWFRKLKQKMMATMKTRGVWRRWNMHHLKNIHCCHTVVCEDPCFPMPSNGDGGFALWCCCVQPRPWIPTNLCLGIGMTLINKPGLFIRGFHDVFF